MATYRWIGNGCPPSDRLALCKAYITKAVWDFATTRDLIAAEQMLKMLDNKNRIWENVNAFAI